MKGPTKRLCTPLNKEKGSLAVFTTQTCLKPASQALKAAVMPAAPMPTMSKDSALASALRKSRTSCWARTIWSRMLTLIWRLDRSYTRGATLWASRLRLSISSKPGVLEVLVLMVRRGR
jgi:hypothetical protein